MRYLLLVVALIASTSNSFSQIYKHTQVYVGGKLQISDNKNGGVWSMTNATATIGSSTGLVTGTSRGTDTIICTFVKRNIFGNPDTTATDSSTIYTSTSDSSGYYFESDTTGAYVMELRDCDGATILNLWEGGNKSTSSAIFSNRSTLCLWNNVTNVFQFIFPGVLGQNGETLNIKIAAAKIKDLNGISPSGLSALSIYKNLQLIGF